MPSESNVAFAFTPAVGMMERWIAMLCKCVPVAVLSLISLTGSFSSVAIAATDCVRYLFRTQLPASR